MMLESQTPTWRLANGRIVRLDSPRIMAIVNVTPDSFSDGGLHDVPDRAAEYALHCVEQGADILDIGGESTRPGAAVVASDEQINRVVPTINAILRARPDAMISVDTRSSEVVRAALEAGAVVVNDVSGGRDDPALLEVTAQHGAGIILMHRPCPSDVEVFSHEYGPSDKPSYPGGVVATVRGALAQLAHSAIEAGVDAHAIVVDPGLGFGKTVEQNFELIRDMPEIASLGYPVLSASSRKSFIGYAGGESNPALRAPGTVVISLYHFMQGIRLFRVHDVAAHRQAFRVAQQIRSLGSVDSLVAARRE